MGSYAARPSAQSKLPEVVNGVLCISKRGTWTPVPGRWLRDNCPCCRNPQTGQKSVNVLKLTSRACGIERVVDVPATETFEISFEDGHRSVIPYSCFTDVNSYVASQWREGLVPLTTWTNDVATTKTTVQYEDVKAGPGMARLLRTIREYGFALVDDTPVTPEATEDLLSSIGPIRNTHYGAFYDFTSDLSSKDTAYTSEALDPHTDTTYFTEPAGLQALHMLSHENGSGGESILVDGFGAAVRLYKEDEPSYRTLSTTGVYSHASGNEGISIQPAQPFPTFNHHPAMGHLMQVRWNTADRAGLGIAMHNVGHWYRAAAAFDKLVSDPANQYRFQLKPGRVLSSLHLHS